MALTLALTGITKRYGEFTAVDDVNMHVPAGSVFGFLGPNGAGKSTTMRMIMDVLIPDAGDITWRGEPINDALRGRFGYLPEERGLYPRMKVGEQLTYLAELKGLTRADARQRVSDWLERLEIGHYVDKRVDQLSKGNQQKVQFVSAVAHDPELVILDEPFSGLDPLNVDLLRGALQELRQRGTTILFSTHRMDTVEDLCRDVALINRGRIVLAGNLLEIKRAARRHVIRLGLAGSYDFLEQFPDMHVQTWHDEYVEIGVPDTFDPNVLLQAALANGRVTQFNLGLPSLHEIYVQKVGETIA
jgi:ABC-2 type transport system ATP-binding protein